MSDRDVAKGPPEQERFGPVAGTTEERGKPKAKARDRIPFSQRATFYLRNEPPNTGIRSGNPVVGLGDG